MHAGGGRETGNLFGVALQESLNKFIIIIIRLYSVQH